MSVGSCKARSPSDQSEGLRALQDPTLKQELAALLVSKATSPNKYHLKTNHLKHRISELQLQLSAYKQTDSKLKIANRKHAEATNKLKQHYKAKIQLLKEQLRHQLAEIERLNNEIAQHRLLGLEIQDRQELRQHVEQLRQQSQELRTENQRLRGLSKKS